jgi:hypothetical protein
MKRLSLLTLVFAVVFVVFLVLLIFFRIPFALYPLMSWQDAIDILTPVVLIPLYWLMFKYASEKNSTLAQEIAFIVLAVLWVAGQGMHLSANSVNNLSESFAKKRVLDILGTDIYKLTYFYDEHLSHYLWHIGVLGLPLILILREWRSPVGQETKLGLAIPAGIIHGFTISLISLEGQTALLGFPFSILVSLVMLFWGLKGMRQRPIRAFFFITFLLAAILFLVWLLINGNFVEPTKVLNI